MIEMEKTNELKVEKESFIEDWKSWSVHEKGSLIIGMIAQLFVCGIYLFILNYGMSNNITLRLIEMFGRQLGALIGIFALLGSATIALVINSLISDVFNPDSRFKKLVGKKRKEFRKKYPLKLAELKMKEFKYEYKTKQTQMKIKKLTEEINNG